jgi:antitoxin MazE
LDLKYGSSVEITSEDGKLVIIPERTTLESLISQVSEENIHASVDTGSSVGKEAW